MKPSLSLFALITALFGFFSSTSCSGQQHVGVASSVSPNEIFGWIDYQPSEVNTVGLQLYRADGGATLHLALIATDGSFVAFGEPIVVLHSFEQFAFEIFDLNSGEPVAQGEVVVVVDTEDLGDEWTPLDIKDENNWTGCEGVATNIKNTLGGSAEIKVIKPKTDGLKLGEYRDVGTGWYEHHVVVKNGKVYDGFGPRTGLPIEEYKDLWKHKDDINFGF
jgi:hypothetical protein